MADNYLENKMEALQKGPKIVKRPSVSVEGLLKRLGDRPGDQEGSVMPAQIEAIARDAGLLEEAKVFRLEPDGDSIRILGPSSPRKYLVEAGEVVMAMRMKAAELHLSSSVELRPESNIPGDLLIATVKFRHP